MEAGRNNTIVPSIRVNDMQKSLDFYTQRLGLQITDKLTREDGTIVHASVGFDSALLMLSPVESPQTSEAKDDLARNKLGVGVEFYIRMNESQRLDKRSPEVKAQGVTPIEGIRTELWNDDVCTLTDPDGYVLSFGEHIEDVAQRRAWTNVGQPDRPADRRRQYASIFTTQ